MKDVMASVACKILSSVFDMRVTEALLNYYARTDIVKPTGEPVRKFNYPKESAKYKYEEFQKLVALFELKRVGIPPMFLKLSNSSVVKNKFKASIGSGESTVTVELSSPSFKEAEDVYKSWENAKDFNGK